MDVEKPIRGLANVYLALGILYREWGVDSWKLRTLPNWGLYSRLWRWIPNAKIPLGKIHT